MGLIGGDKNVTMVCASKKALLSKLNSREWLVFNALCEMKSYQEMSLDFGLTFSGIKYRVGNIYRKLEIKSCAEGVASKRLVFMREFMDCKKKEWVEL